MDEDGVELTSYLRERHRTDGRPAGETLIELYAGRRTSGSFLVRGIEGFGRHRPRAGRPLPLADDPPLVAIAVGTRPGIAAVLGEALALTQPRLTVTAGVRILSGEIDPVWLGEHPGEATKLTLYCGSRDRVYQVPAFEAACELLYRRGVAGASVLSGADGSVAGRRQRAQFLRRDAGAPLAIIAVGAGDQIAMVLPELGGLFRHPLMTVAKVSVCKRDGQLLDRPPVRTGTAGGGEPDAPASPDLAAAATARLRLTIYTCEAARHEGQPVHQALIRRLRSAGVSGATSLRGIWGFAGDRPPHGDRFPRHGRHVPVITSLIDTPERISAAFDAIDMLTPAHGLVTAEPVRALRQPERPLPSERDRPRFPSHRDRSAIRAHVVRRHGGPRRGPPRHSR